MKYASPYTPGAGAMPSYLAGRNEVLMNALHRVNQFRLPIIVYGAGLPEVLKILGEVKPYAERLFKYILISKLPDEEAADAIINTTKESNVIYEDERAEEMF